MATTAFVLAVLPATGAAAQSAVPPANWAGALARAAQPCTVTGTNGPDTLTGTGGADVICGRDGDDTITGLGGDDTIRAGGGNDTANGGPGNDRVLGWTGDDSLSGGDGQDRILGEAGGDILNGNNHADLVVGGGGADNVSGGAGVDRTSGGGDDDTVNGGADADEVLGGGGVDWLLGSTGADRLHGGPGYDTVNGGADNDDVRGGLGNDTLLGSTGDDLLQDRDGSPYVDNLECGDGTDRANVDFFDSVAASCEVRRNLDRDDPVAVDDTLTVDEDDPVTTVDVLANDTDTDGGPIKVGSVTQPADGTVVITSLGADLTYVPDADYCNDGTPTDDFTYTLSPGGDIATVAVTVTCVADVPVAVDDTLTVDEDDPATTIDVLANDAAAGNAIFVDAVNQPTNGTVVITNAGADLTYQPDADYCNDGAPTDDFTYTLSHGGDTATVAVTVTCVADAPDAVDDTAAFGEDDPAATIDVLGNDSDADGDALTIDQVTQPPNGTVAITNAGTDLTYAPDANYCNDGVTTDDFTYTLTPGGDTATVAVTVTCVVDPAVATDDATTVSEDDSATTINVLANDTVGDTGPMSVTAVTQPSNGTVGITNAGADLSYQPDPNYCNAPPGTVDDTFTYTLGPDNDMATVTVTVTCVNDAPVADDETIDGANAAVGNTVLVHDDTTDAAPAESGPRKVVTGDLLNGDADIDSAGPLTITAEDVTSVDNGSATIQPDGDFVFTPAATTSCTDTTDSFDYTVNDGDGGSDVGTVTIHISGCVWYVHNDAGGDAGTSTAPFDTLAQAEAASGAGHTIFVFDGNDTSTGYGGNGLELKAGQHLVGEHSDLQVGTDLLHAANPGARPTLTATDADVVSLAAGNTVTGVVIDPSGTGGGISGGVGDVNGTIAHVAITDVNTAGTQPALELAGTSGTFTISDLETVTSATAIRLNNADTVNFVDTGTISVRSTAAKALDLTGTNLGTSVFDSVTAVSGSSGISVTDTTGSLTFRDLNLTSMGPAAAFALSNAAGVTVLESGAADVLALGGPAVDVTGSSTPSLSFDSVTSLGSSTDGVNLDGLTTGTFSATGTIRDASGIAFDVHGGSGAVSYAGFLNDGSGATAEITGRSGGTVTLSGSIADSNDAGGGITLASNSGGSTTFSNGSKVLNTGATHAVSMTSSNGHTLNLTGGGLDIDTTTGRGLNTDDSGTVTVTGTGNTVDSTTGRALSIVSTDIGADDVIFQRVSSDGASQGIVLDATGSLGNLAVTGNGGTCTIADTSGCSGGTIANSVGGDDSSTAPAGTGILLRDTIAPSFTRVRINNADNYGIRGTNVTGLTVSDSVIHGTIGTSSLTEHKDGGLRFEQLTGSVNVTDTEVSGGYFTNVMVDNNAGVLNATFDNVDSLALDAAGGDDAVQFEGIGTSDMNVVYTNSQVTTASGDLFQYIGDGTGGGDLDLTSNGFTNNEPSIVTGGGGIAIVGGAKGAVTLDILNNTMRDSLTNALTVIKSRDRAGGTNDLTADITGNTIGVAGTANSGSVEGDGMEITTFGDGNATFNVTNNDIRQYNSTGITFISGGGVEESGQMNLNVSGNTVANPGTNPNITLFQGIRVESAVHPDDTFATCIKFGPNSISGSGGVPGDLRDFRLVVEHNTTLRQPGYTGGNTDGAAFADYAASLIGGGAQGTAVANAPGVFSGSGTTCP